MSRTLMRFTGVGGQGVLLAGEILATAKNKSGGYGLKTATYTSQVRGGPTVVDITLDEEEILYPYADDGEIHFMLSVAQVSYDLFKKGVSDGGIIVIDSNLIKPTQEDKKRWKIIEIPIIMIAKEEIRNVVTQSVIALSIANNIMKAIDKEFLKEIMIEKVPSKARDINLAAYEIGYKYSDEAIKNFATHLS